MSTQIPVHVCDNCQRPTVVGSNGPCPDCGGTRYTRSTEDSQSVPALTSAEFNDLANRHTLQNYGLDSSPQLTPAELTALADRHALHVLGLDLASRVRFLDSLSPQMRALVQARTMEMRVLARGDMLTVQARTIIQQLAGLSVVARLNELTALQRQSPLLYDRVIDLNQQDARAASSLVENSTPSFFDVSSVTRPADRAAYTSEYLQTPVPPEEDSMTQRRSRPRRRSCSRVGCPRHASVDGLCSHHHNEIERQATPQVHAPIEARDPNSALNEAALQVMREEGLDTVSRFVYLRTPVLQLAAHMTLMRSPSRTELVRTLRASRRETVRRLAEALMAHISNSATDPNYFAMTGPNSREAQPGQPLRGSVEPLRGSVELRAGEGVNLENLFAAAAVTIRSVANLGHSYILPDTAIFQEFTTNMARAGVSAEALDRALIQSSDAPLTNTYVQCNHCSLRYPLRNAPQTPCSSPLCRGTQVTRWDNTVEPADPASINILCQAPGLDFIEQCASCETLRLASVGANSPCGACGSGAFRIHGRPFTLPESAAVGRDSAAEVSPILRETIEGYLRASTQRLAQRVRQGDWVRLTPHNGIFEKIAAQPAPSVNMDPGRPMVVTAPVARMQVIIDNTLLSETIEVQVNGRTFAGRRPLPGSSDPPLLLPCCAPNCRSPHLNGRPWCREHTQAQTGDSALRHVAIRFREVRQLLSEPGTAEEVKPYLAAENDLLNQFVRDQEDRLLRQRQARAQLLEREAARQHEAARTEAEKEKELLAQLMAKHGVRGTIPSGNASRMPEPGERNLEI
jgi:hypothetical protein